MQIGKTFIALLCAASFCACEHVVTEEGSGYFEVKKNDHLWQGRAELSFAQHAAERELVILGVRDGQHGYALDVIGLRIQFQGEGVYALAAGKGFYYTTIGGDVVASAYESFEPSTDQVVITKYDRRGNAVSGTFHFRARDENETVTFSSGRFVAVVQD